MAKKIEPYCCKGCGRDTRAKGGYCIKCTTCGRFSGINETQGRSGMSTKPGHGFVNAINEDDYSENSMGPVTSDQYERNSDDEIHGEARD